MKAGVLGSNSAEFILLTVALTCALTNLFNRFGWNGGASSRRRIFSGGGSSSGTTMVGDIAISSLSSQFDSISKLSDAFARILWMCLASGCNAGSAASPTLIRNLGR